MNIKYLINVFEGRLFMYLHALHKHMIYYPALKNFNDCFRRCCHAHCLPTPHLEKIGHRKK